MMTQNQNRIEPMQQPPSGNGGKKTLVGIVGIAVAIALGVSIPEDESGRIVRADVNPVTKALEVKNIRGKQYLDVYLDVVGVATACDGLTTDPQGNKLRVGQKFSEEQCSLMLEQALIAHAERVMACSPGLTISRDYATEKQRQGPRFAAISLGYNVGTAAYCRSTARRLFNAGQYKAGCDALLAWNKAGGRVLRGLQLRRERERAVCLKGL